MSTPAARSASSCNAVVCSSVETRVADEARFVDRDTWGSSDRAKRAPRAFFAVAFNGFGVEPDLAAIVDAGTTEPR